MQRDPIKAVEVYIEHQADRLDRMVRQVRALTSMVGANITLTILVLGKLLVALRDRLTLWTSSSSSF